MEKITTSQSNVIGKRIVKWIKNNERNARDKQSKKLGLSKMYQGKLYRKGTMGFALAEAEGN